MIINDLLKEKYKIQQKLSESSKDIHEYFKKSHESTVEFMNKYGVSLKYGDCEVTTKFFKLERL